MPLIAILTTGWPIEPTNQLSAIQLHEKAECSENDYRGALLEQIGHLDVPLNLDKTFRRSPTGFGPIQKLVSGLVDQEKEVRCQIDAFSFAFLKGAKNYDLLVNVDSDSLQQVKTQLSEWKSAVNALTDFERFGNSLDESWQHLEKIYLFLRSVVGRPSAKDERRTLVVLLITGPATSDEIKEDLRLNYSLSKRVMNALVNTGALELRKGSSQYAIKPEAIPVVLFFIQELMGLDMLAMLDSIKESSYG